MPIVVVVVVAVVVEHEVGVFDGLVVKLFCSKLLMWLL